MSNSDDEENATKATTSKLKADAVNITEGKTDVPKEVLMARELLSAATKTFEMAQHIRKLEGTIDKLRRKIKKGSRSESESSTDQESIDQSDECSSESDFDESTSYKKRHKAKRRKTKRRQKKSHRKESKKTKKVSDVTKRENLTSAQNPVPESSNEDSKEFSVFLCQLCGKPFSEEMRHMVKPHILRCAKSRGVSPPPLQGIETKVRSQKSDGTHKRTRVTNLPHSPVVIDSAEEIEKTYDKSSEPQIGKKALVKRHPTAADTKLVVGNKIHKNTEELEMTCPDCGLKLAKVAKVHHAKVCRKTPVCLYCAKTFSSIHALEAHKPACKAANWQDHPVRLLQHEINRPDGRLKRVDLKNVTTVKKGPIRIEPSLRIKAEHQTIPGSAENTDDDGSESAPVRDTAAEQDDAATTATAAAISTQLLYKTRIKALVKRRPATADAKLVMESKFHKNAEDLEMNCPDCGLKLAKVAKVHHAKVCKKTPVCLYCAKTFSSIHALEAHKPACKAANWQDHPVRLLQHEIYLPDSRLKRVDLKDVTTVKKEPFKIKSEHEGGEARRGIVFHVCMKCDQQFPSPHELRQHKLDPDSCQTFLLQRQRPGFKQGGRFCRKCMKHFANHQLFMAHTSQCGSGVTESNDKMHNCFICYRGFNTSDELRKHRQLWHLTAKGDTSNCWVCGNMFRTFKELVAHHEESHKGLSMQRRPQRMRPALDQQHLVLTSGSNSVTEDPQGEMEAQELVNETLTLLNQMQHDNVQSQSEPEAANQMQFDSSPYQSNPQGVNEEQSHINSQQPDSQAIIQMQHDNSWSQPDSRATNQVQHSTISVQPDSRVVNQVQRGNLISQTESQAMNRQQHRQIIHGNENIGEQATVEKEWANDLSASDDIISPVTESRAGEKVTVRQEFDEKRDSRGPDSETEEEDLVSIQSVYEKRKRPRIIIQNSPKQISCGKSKEENRNEETHKDTVNSITPDRSDVISNSTSNQDVFEFQPKSTISASPQYTETPSNASAVSNQNVQKIVSALGASGSDNSAIKEALKSLGISAPVKVVKGDTSLLANINTLAGSGQAVMLPGNKRGYVFAVGKSASNKLFAKPNLSNVGFTVTHAEKVMTGGVKESSTTAEKHIGIASNDGVASPEKGRVYNFKNAPENILKMTSNMETGGVSNTTWENSNIDKRQGPNNTVLKEQEAVDKVPNGTAVRRRKRSSSTLEEFSSEEPEVKRVKSLDIDKIQLEPMDETVQDICTKVIKKSEAEKREAKGGRHETKEVSSKSSKSRRSTRRKTYSKAKKSTRHDPKEDKSSKDKNKEKAGEFSVKEKKKSAQIKTKPAVETLAEKESSKDKEVSSRKEETSILKSIELPTTEQPTGSEKKSESKRHTKDKQQSGNKTRDWSSKESSSSSQNKNSLKHTGKDPVKVGTAKKDYVGASKGMAKKDDTSSKMKDQSTHKSKEQTLSKSSKGEERASSKGKDSTSQHSKTVSFKTVNKSLDQPDKLVKETFSTSLSGAIDAKLTSLRSSSRKRKTDTSNKSEIKPSKAVSNKSSSIIASSSKHTASHDKSKLEPIRSASGGGKITQPVKPAKRSITSGGIEMLVSDTDDKIVCSSCRIVMSSIVEIAKHKCSVGVPSKQQRVKEAVTSSAQAVLQQPSARPEPKYSSDSQAHATCETRSPKLRSYYSKRHCHRRHSPPRTETPKSSTETHQKKDLGPELVNMEDAELSDGCNVDIVGDEDDL